MNQASQLQIFLISGFQGSLPLSSPTAESRFSKVGDGWDEFTKIFPLGCVSHPMASLPSHAKDIR
jgi:hypothetical protein